MRSVFLRVTGFAMLMGLLVGVAPVGAHPVEECGGESLTGGEAMSGAPSGQIRIQVGGPPTARTIRVRDRAVALCMQSDPDCPSEVQWKAEGLAADERIVIERKDQSATKRCFPGEPFEVQPHSPKASGAAEAACETAGGIHVWRYTAKLMRGLEMLAEDDPAVIIEGRGGGD